ncbi:MAG: hypothetical protein LBC58_00510 [Clostridiales Family XIII bacterium]|jgi:hypothetical protein|nr:hypothetical protein [Clostridiales Family XIII bacterium]
MEIKNKHSRTAYRVFWGMVFLLAGAAIILNVTGIFEIPSGVDLGDLVWSVALALVFVWSILHRFWFFTFCAIIGAGAVWRDQLGLPNESFWPIAGAALLLSIGLSILLKPKRRYDWSYEYIGRSSPGQGGSDGSEAQTPHKEGVASSGGIHTSATGDDNDVFIKASFGATIKYVNAQALKHAYLDCSFGSIKAFFDNAAIHADGAVIEIDNSFGGVELYIPKEWRLTDDINRMLGGVDVKNPGFEKATGPPVTLTGSVKFGGIEIIYV